MKTARKLLLLAAGIARRSPGCNLALAFRLTVALRLVTELGSASLSMSAEQDLNPHASNSHNSLSVGFSPVSASISVDSFTRQSVASTKQLSLRSSIRDILSSPGCGVEKLRTRWQRPNVSR